MKSLVYRGATLLTAGGILIGSLFAGSLRVLALTDEQVAERLENVPVFTITDQQGAPLVSTPEGENGAPVAGVFIDQTDAQTFLDNLRQENPQLGNSVQIVPVSLAEVYRLALAGQEAERPLEFTFIPDQEDIQSAITLLQNEGQEVSSFEGVPIFIARSNTDGEEGYLTIQQGEEQVIPMFFTQADLQAMLTRLQELQPELANTVSIQVINLEGLINTLEQSDNPELERILLIPPEESIEFIRTRQPQPQQN